MRDNFAHNADERASASRESFAHAGGLGVCHRSIMRDNAPEWKPETHISSTFFQGESVDSA